MVRSGVGFNSDDIMVPFHYGCAVSLETRLPKAGNAFIPFGEQVSDRQLSSNGTPERQSAVCSTCSSLLVPVVASRGELRLRSWPMPEWNSATQKCWGCCADA